jgi:hypothetical protein
MVSYSLLLADRPTGRPADRLGVVCGYRPGQFCRRTAIRFRAFCVQCEHRLSGWPGVMRAGRVGNPLVSRLRVCGALPPLANTGKSSWWCFYSLKPSGHYMYRQFIIQKLYVLPTQCICVDLRTNSDYFPIQH